MKILIVKALIGWLSRNYPFLLREAVVPEGSHIQRHKVSKKRQWAGSYPTTMTMNTDGQEVQG